MNEKCIAFYQFCLFKGQHNIQVPVILSFYVMHKYCAFYLPLSNLQVCILPILQYMYF